MASCMVEYRKRKGGKQHDDTVDRNLGSVLAGRWCSSHYVRQKKKMIECKGSPHGEFFVTPNHLIFNSCNALREPLKEKE